MTLVTRAALFVIAAVAVGVQAGALLVKQGVNPAAVGLAAHALVLVTVTPAVFTPGPPTRTTVTKRH